jgi:hypothetical protein
LLINFASLSLLEAQNLPGLCATDALHQSLLKNNPTYAKKYAENKQKIYQYLKEQFSQKKPSSNNLSQKGEKDQDKPLYTIPVVIHIIHNDENMIGMGNIPDKDVILGIEDLNKAFRHKAPYDGELGVDVEIEFVLAKQDPEGNPTNGIIRKKSGATNHIYPNTITLARLSSWDSKRYLNIWLVSTIRNPSDNLEYGGYAYFSSSHGEFTDGVVCVARAFGSGVPFSTLQIHEVGHYFDLHHTFNGGCINKNCLNDGDMVCDTPPHTPSFQDCSASVNTCQTDEDDTSESNPFRPVALGGLGDQNDMHQNYMDYSNVYCKNAFTQGQKERMLATLTGPRASLLNSKGSIPPTILNAEQLQTTISEDNFIVKIDWQFKNPHNYQKFIIQRSSNNENFVEIATITNIMSKQSFQFFDDLGRDKSLLKWYYRIKMVDFVDKLAFSPLVSVEIVPDKPLYIFPQPVKSGENLSIAFYQPNKSKKISIQLLNMWGRQLFNYSYIIYQDVAQYDLITNHLRAGIYILKIFYEDKWIIKRIRID